MVLYFSVQKASFAYHHVKENRQIKNVTRVNSFILIQIPTFDEC